MDHLENILNNFTYGNYHFILFGASTGEITYKITPLVHTPQPDKFYNDIMNNENLNITLGLALGYIILTKNAYIDIDDIEKTYYMVLNIKISEFSDYTRLLGNFPIKKVYNEFIPMNIGDNKYPVSISIDEIEIADNSFCNKYFVSINISRVNDFTKIRDDINRDIIDKVDYYINSSINNTHLLKIGFEHKYVADVFSNSINIIGYVSAVTVNDVKVLDISENSIIIEESNKWIGEDPINEHFNAYDIISYIYNTEKFLFSPIIVLSDRITIENDIRFHNLEFETGLFLLEDSAKHKIINKEFETTDFHFVPYFIKGTFNLYKNRKMFNTYDYCGYIHHNKQDELIAFINANKKKFAKASFNFFYADTTRSYFIIKSTYKIKGIYDLIRTKIKWGNRKI